MDFISWLRVFFAAFTLLFGNSFPGSFLSSFKEKLPGYTPAPPSQFGSLATKLSKEVSCDSLSLTTFVRWPLTEVVVFKEKVSSGVVMDKFCVRGGLWPSRQSGERRPSRGIAC